MNALVRRSPRMKTCPFCGGRAAGPWRWMGNKMWPWRVHCAVGCGAIGPDGYTKAAAIKIWNSAHDA